MLGTFVNVAAILVGGIIGLVIKRGVPERIAETAMKGLGLCTLYIGVSGCLKGENPLVTILSIVIGAVIGEGIDLDDKLNKLGLFIEDKFRSEGQKTSISEGFVTSSLLFCVGAMAIVGSLKSGLLGDHEMLFAKSMLDFVGAIIFASTLGVGVLFSAAAILVYQGGITLLAQFVSPYLGDKTVAEMTCVGSIIIMALAFNMLGITKLKVMNYVPAIFLPILFCLFIK